MDIGGIDIKPGADEETIEIPMEQFVKMLSATTTHNHLVKALRARHGDETTEAMLEEAASHATLEMLELIGGVVRRKMADPDTQEPGHE